RASQVARERSHGTGGPPHRRPPATVASAGAAAYTRRVAEHEVDVVATAAVPTAVIATATTWAEFPQLWPRLLDEGWRTMRTAPHARPGRNVMLYRDAVPHVEVGVELAGGFEGDGRVVVSALPAGEAAMTVARGAPSAQGIGAAHDAVVAWCRAGGRELTGVRWEVYGHWLDDQDPAQYEIGVYWQLS